VDDWFAEAELDVVLLPLPTFTPGLTFAPRFTSELLTPTFASTPTLGLMLYVRDGDAALVLLLEADGGVGPKPSPVLLAPPWAEVPEADPVAAEPDMPALEFEFSVLPFTTLPDWAAVPAVPLVVVLGTAYVLVVEFVVVALFTLVPLPLE